MDINTTSETNRPSRRRVWIGASVAAAAIAVGASAYALSGPAAAATGDTDETEQVLEPGTEVTIVSDPAPTDDATAPVDTDSAASSDSGVTEQVLEPGTETEVVSDPARTDDATAPVDADATAGQLEADGTCFVQVSAEADGEPVVETKGGPSKDCPEASIESTDDGSVEMTGADGTGATPAGDSGK